MKRILYLWLFALLPLLTASGQPSLSKTYRIRSAQTGKVITNGGDAGVDVASELDNYLALMGWALKEEE